MPVAHASARTLRSIFSHSILVVGLLAVTSAGALITTSTVLQGTTADVAAAVESVHLVEEAEVNLLLHARAKDPLIRRDIEGELRSAFERARGFVTSRSEQRILERAELSVEAYIAAALGPDEARVADAETAAFAALEHLVDINVKHTRTAHAKAIRWDRIANITGFILGGAIIVVSIALVLWLRRRVIHPLFSLAETVHRFGEGQRTVRAQSVGPRELQDMSRRFNEMAEAIATQRQAQVAFLGGVAHDLRTPLSALSVATDLLGPDAPLPPEPQVRRVIEIIARQIHHLERMVGDFVDMSTIEGGQLDLQLDLHDVRDVARDAVELFVQDEAVRGRITVAVPSSPCIALCDDVRVGQAVTNLMSNAIKYSPAGAPIDVRVRVDAGELLIEVTDRGVGIAREDHDRIFEPFRRVGAKAQAKGAGLGLFNVKRIVEAHAGRIEIESVPRRGSTFRICLPVGTATAVPERWTPRDQSLRS